MNAIERMREPMNDSALSFLITRRDAVAWLRLARAAQERIDAELALADAADKGIAKEQYRIVDDAREDEIDALRRLQEDTDG